MVRRLDELIWPSGQEKAAYRLHLCEKAGERRWRCSSMSQLFLSKFHVKMYVKMIAVGEEAPYLAVESVPILY